MRGDIIFPLPFPIKYLAFTEEKTFWIWASAITSWKYYPNYDAIYDRPIKMKFIASRVARGNIFLCRQNIIRNGDLSYIRLLVPGHTLTVICCKWQRFALKDSISVYWIKLHCNCFPLHQEIKCFILPLFLLAFLFSLHFWSKFWF